MKITDTKGNALFLILIAVALFAALSYAVTQSGRGGSGIDKEKAEILAAQIIQELNAIRQAYYRLDLIGGYDQVLFNDSAETTSGTCYDGSVATTPCHTIGLFNVETGVNLPNWTAEMRDPAFSTTTFLWFLQNRRVQIDGNELGTTDADTFIGLNVIPPEICAAINRQLGAPQTALVPNMISSSTGSSLIFLRDDNTFTVVVPDSTTASTGRDFPYVGCVASGTGLLSTFLILDEN